MNMMLVVIRMYSAKMSDDVESCFTCSLLEYALEVSIVRQSCEGERGLDADGYGVQ